ncbi:MAG TPA: M48 family metallopeptidase [Syntrophales bacterium]|nr:M48 family metallopeptidase [Syntrophales bacterium]
MIEWNILWTAFLTALLCKTLTKWFLSRIDIRNLNRYGAEVPAVFQGEIDQVTLSRMRDYAVTGARFGHAEDLFDDGLILLLLLTGFFAWLVTQITVLDLPFVLEGNLFWLILLLGSTVSKIPFDLYRTFIIEKKYGFSTTTLTLWIGDLTKNAVISACLMLLFMTVLLFLLQWLPLTWWLWVWIAFSLLQLLLSGLYPVLIAPLFNKYVPIQDEVLRDRIVGLMGQAGIRAKGVFQVDAGKRSRHTNAYFTGLGRTKRIVLYDTLLEAHDHEEILSILAHEIGHWKKKHVMKQIMAMECFTLLALGGVFFLLQWPLLYRTFGFPLTASYAGLFLVFLLMEPLLFFMTPLVSVISRRYERQADRYAVGMVGTGTHLARAMKKLARDNLANLHPHPFYAWFYYSHPPLVGRINALEKMGDYENERKS